MPRGRPRKVQEQDITDSVQAVEVSQTEVSQTGVAPNQPVAKRSGRPSRVSINGYRDVLKVEGQEPGWHYAWITDDNIPRFQDAGFVFVEHDVVVGNRRVNAASQVGSHVSIPGGNGVTLFLMRCEEDIYDEEMQLIQDDVDAKERALLSINKDEGRYGSIKISRE